MIIRLFPNLFSFFLRCFFPEHVDDFMSLRIKHGVEVKPSSRKMGVGIGDGAYDTDFSGYFHEIPTLIGELRGVAIKAI